MKQLLFFILLVAGFNLHAEQISATVSWAQIATLSTPLNGVVSSVKVEIGDTVKKGQLLATLDARPYKSELKRAEAVMRGRSSSYDEEKRELERAEELFERTVLSQTELQAAQLKHSIAEADFLRAEAEVEVAKINLQYGKIHAPFNGIIVERNTHPGEVVANNFKVTPMLRVALANRLQATAVISIDQANQLSVGDEVQLSFNESMHNGKVRSIQPDKDSVHFILKIIFETMQKTGGWGIATFDL